MGPFQGWSLAQKSATAPSAGIFHSERTRSRSTFDACSVHHPLSTAVGSRTTRSPGKPRDFKYSTPPDDETTTPRAREKMRRSSFFFIRSFHVDCVLQLRRLCESETKRIGVP